MENLDENNKKERSFLLVKKLVELRIKKVTRQKFQPNEFSKTKKELARLLTSDDVLSKSNINTTLNEFPLL
jgi:ribosomal protein L29